MDPFVYADDVECVGIKHAHVALVPSGLEGRDALFRCLVRQLALPDYFGANWDAFEECLRDLSWIDSNRVVLFHQELPALDDDQLSTYLEILRDAVIDWRRDVDDEFVVGLPLSARDRVSRLPRPAG